jgi:hypothetical protein
MEYITAKEAAEKWGISQRRVQVLCGQNRVNGANRLGWAWAIPENARKPRDSRLKMITENSSRCLVAQQMKLPPNYERKENYE